MSKPFPPPPLTQDDAPRCLDAVNYFLEQIEKNSQLNAFVRTYPEQARAQAKEIAMRCRASSGGSLAGMAIGIKDLICDKGHPVSASSAILSHFTSQITATAVERIRAADGVILGHQNCDEFGMGNRTIHSVYGPAGHPIDPTFSPGGSSGGSAAAVSAGLCHASIGTDTGGSVRQPAALCGVVGLKPTYGRIPRYGVIAYASSFDTVGILTRDIPTCALILSVIAGEDKRDTTSSSRPVADYASLLTWKKKAKIVYLEEALCHPALTTDIRIATKELLDKLRRAGHEVTPLSLPLLDQAIPTYYTLACAEASTNLARYDGIRYGRSYPEAKTVEELYIKSRTIGLGKEVRKRILLGTLVLSSSYYDSYYARAQRVRRSFCKAIASILATHDFILLPTTPSTAPKQSAPQHGIEGYLEDLYTVPASLTGLPAISLPYTTSQSGWPIGVQLIGRSFQEEDLLAFSQTVMSEMIA